MGLVQSGEAANGKFHGKELESYPNARCTVGQDLVQWEFQDPKIEVLYHTSGHIVCLIYGRCLQFRSVFDA